MKSPRGERADFALFEAKSKKKHHEGHGVGLWVTAA